MMMLMLLLSTAAASTSCSKDDDDNSEQTSKDDGDKSEETSAKAPSSAKAIDLGLSVKWANMNIGAESPLDYGYYFAWGEISQKDDYSKSTYIYYSSAIWIDPDGFPVDDPGYTKYVTQKSAGDYGYHDSFDNKTQLDKKDDAAYMNWGGKWRMPTKEELEELNNKCAWSRVKVSNVEVFKVTGPSGNFIYLPFAGSYSFHSDGRSADYWSSTLRSDKAEFAYTLHTVDTRHYVQAYSRTFGFSIRPVSE